ncbi:ABC bile acid transporter [Blastomyces gilchristii SLH14081]|uniref:ABC bile acid transporter n=1 Tax=Blastomyces gilchristii (strain SLH14081) TaxID=559298 RepID=A0A179UI56_BLAGS|nr:ABC bile acid transporter [Blastomyces gilchristii SLH14081]OAT06162.1 ABC bile acid transporter [Blastomyces gilchristii SLH14081]
MIEEHTASLLIGTSGLIVVALCTISGLLAILSRLSLRSRVGYIALQEIYQDRDGAATEESIQRFSQKAYYVSIICFSIIGLLVSLAQAVLSTISEDRLRTIEPWLQLSIWVLVVLNSIALLVEPSPTKKFTIGLYISTSTLLYIVLITMQTFFIYPNSNYLDLSDARGALVLVQLVIAFICACVSVLLPRRPDVFRNGKVVDAQYTTSWIGRLTFSWPSGLLKEIRRTKTLDVEYLPQLDYPTRAKSLLEAFDKTKNKSPRLWKVLIRVYLSPLLVQFVLVVISALLSFAPQICLLQILRALEARSRGEWNSSEAWWLVFALGMSTLVFSTIESWLYWVSFAKLCIPVYEQVAAVVFTKSMRRKNVKGSQASSSPDDQGSNQNGNQTLKDDADAEDDNQKTNQGTINLVAVDAKRISDFAAYNYFIPSTTIKLTVAFTILGLLIGWKSLCSGLLVSVVVTPVNIFVASKYSGSQISLMKFRDQKMVVITEVLQGIRQIKFSALENQWQRKIGDIRKAELNAQWAVFRYDIVLIGIWIMGPVMLSAVSLGVYYKLNGELAASVAFTTVSIFSSLELTLAILPELITDFIEAWVSAGRIEKFLTSAEKGHNTLPSDHICFEKATIAWPVEDADETDGRFSLQDISLSFPPKGLSVISGKTGSGKSLLIASILGESDILSGAVRVPEAPPLEDRFNDNANKENWIIDSAIAYVAQIPWIENATIKDNILFGLPLDSERYHKVLFACALEKDLDMLPDGELTDIGANGINLSGGQKWRISFARALYSRAGILIMDDLFSALDAHTGRHLHVHALTGELGRGRTRILVTHHVALCLGETDYSVYLQNDTVGHAGTVDELRRTGELTEILADKANEAARQSDEVEENIDGLGEGEDGLHKVLSRGPQAHTNAVTSDAAVKSNKVPAKFQQDEWRETGSVKVAHYKTYFQSGGNIWYWLFVAFAFLAYIIMTVGRSWWISIWTRSSSASTTEGNLSVMTHIVKRSEPASPNASLLYYLGIYVGLSLITCVLGPLRYGLFFNASINASRNLFDRLTYAVLRAPLRWLDTIPVGRILNRFTADFNMIDSRLGSDFGSMLYHVLQVLGIMAAGLLVSPILILFAMVLLAISLYYSLYYLDGAREIKRLESTVKSPVYEQFGTALTGLTTIRAFGKVPTYINRMFTKIDRHAQAYWHLWLFNRWLGFRMSTIGSIFAVITAALVVSMKGIDASLAGFALSFAMQYTNAIAYALREYTNIELNMNATERVIEYSEIDIEPQDGFSAPAGWPTAGRLEVSDLVIAYAPDLPPVLKGLSFKVEKNQRVGVVGRTGAGKSSLTLALFRFLEARGGTIHVDGIDVSKIKLHDLRSRLAIIPQDPVLFSGTIRSNLDPFEEFSDTQLRDALERVHLVPSSLVESATSTQPCSSSSPPQTSTGSTTPTLISGESCSTAAANANANIFRNLDSTISEGGLNLSQGQRQLLCLARAIVSQPKIMVLDEATSAVDMATDTLIQRSIRSEFGRNSTTLLVIAHRLSTIADFDRILVMDAGKAVEFGAPKDLMQIDNGVFRGLVEESGEREVLKQIILGE